MGHVGRGSPTVLVGEWRASLPLGMPVVYHITALDGELVDGLGIVFQSLLHHQMFFHHGLSNQFILVKRKTCVSVCLPSPQPFRNRSRGKEDGVGDIKI